MEGALAFFAARTTSGGNNSEYRTSSGFRCEISQFWQFRHLKLQPVVAMENMGVAG
jgi:hypothetical protein